jgi:hypothetical protein
MSNISAFHTALGNKDRWDVFVVDDAGDVFQWTFTQNAAGVGSGWSVSQLPPAPIPVTG